MIEKILFKTREDSKEICHANIFSNEPYVTFVDSSKKMIEGTGYEFNTLELRGKVDELQELAKNFIKNKGWILIN